MYVDSEPACNSSAVSEVILEAVLQSSEPILSEYNCSIKTTTPSPNGSFCYFAVVGFQHVLHSFGVSPSPFSL